MFVDKTDGVVGDAILSFEVLLEENLAKFVNELTIACRCLGDERYSQHGTTFVDELLTKASKELVHKSFAVAEAEVYSSRAQVTRGENSNREEVIFNRFAQLRLNLQVLLKLLCSGGNSQSSIIGNIEGKERSVGHR